jgi:aspartyl-tRNA(Asn)/glutamyl-tRNA(Gln) amidotransferase subunit A
MATDLHYLTITEAAALLRDKKLSPLELTQAHLARIAALQSRLHAYITVTAEQALAQARAAESEIMAGEYRGLLHGIPLAHKDIVWTKGVRTTAHSRLLADWVPSEDAFVYAKLVGAGAVSLGKTALHEFAYGVPGSDEAFPAARNPWNADRAPGSSSSGSGAAVAAGLAMGAIGTDTGGSVRHPAAVCGIVGMKATYGRVSIHGVLPLAASMDHAGPMTRTVRDNAVMLQAMAGHNPADPTSADKPVPDFSGLIGASLKGVRIGIPEQFIASVQHEPEVLSAFESAKSVLRELGATLRAVDIAGLGDINDYGTTILTYEAYQYHKDNLAKHPSKYGKAFRDRVMPAANLTEKDYKAATEKRERLRQAYARVFGLEVDVIVSPGRESGAPTMAALMENPLVIRGTAHRMYNLSGHPAIVQPMGFNAGGMPLGLQIAADHWREDLVYQVASAFEDATSWANRHPSL